MHWHGLSYVHVKGHRYKRIGKKKVDELLKKFDEANFFEIPDYIAMKKERQKAILAEIKATGFVPPEGTPERASIDRAFSVVMDGPQPYSMTLNTGERKRTISYYQYPGEVTSHLAGTIWQAVPGSEKWLLTAPDPWRSHCREDH